MTNIEKLRRLIWNLLQILVVCLCWCCQWSIKISANFFSILRVSFAKSRLYKELQSISINMYLRYILKQEIKSKWIWSCRTEGENWKFNCCRILSFFYRKKKLLKSREIEKLKSLRQSSRQKKSRIWISNASQARSMLSNYEFEFKHKKTSIIQFLHLSSRSSTLIINSCIFSSIEITISKLFANSSKKSEIKNNESTKHKKLHNSST